MPLLNIKTVPISFQILLSSRVSSSSCTCLTFFEGSNSLSLSLSEIWITSRGCLRPLPLMTRSSCDSNTANIFLLPTFQNFRPGSVKEASHDYTCFTNNNSDYFVQGLYRAGHGLPVMSICGNWGEPHTSGTALRKCVNIHT